MLITAIKRFGLLVIVLALAVSACSDPDVKKASFLAKGKEFYEQSNYVKARLEFRNSIQIDLKYAEAYFMLGKTEIKLKSFKKAYGAFLKAVELDPENLEAQVELGKLLVAGRSFEKAGETADLILQKEPQNVDGLLIRAKIFTEKGELEDAKKILNNLLAGDSGRVDHYLLLATVEAKNGRVQAAEEVIELGLEKNPDEIRLHTILAELYVKTGRTALAIKTLRQMVKLDSANVSYNFTLAGLLWGIDQKQEAEKIFSQLKKDAEAAEEVSINIAKFYITKRQVEKGEQELLAAIDKWPASFAARYVLTELYAGTSRTAMGIELLKDALLNIKDPAHPDSIKSKNALARMYLSSGNMVVAEKYVQEVIDASPNNIEGHFIKGSVLLLKNDGTGAISDFRTVVNERPDFVAGYLKLAEAYVQSGQKGLAFDLLNGALENMPNSKELLRALAKLNAFDKNYAQAEKLLKKIIEQNKDDLSAKSELGDLFLSLRRFSDAERQYKLIQKDAPQNPLSYLRLGRLYVAKGDMTKAVAQFQEGFYVVPQSNALLSALVQTSLRSKDFSTAELACNSRVQKSAHDIYALNLLGKVYSAQKDFVKAERQFEKAIEIQPLWPEPHSNLAKIYLAQGKQDEAIGKFKANLERDPTKMSNYLFLGIIYEQTKMFDQAIDIYEQSLGENPSFWVAANNLAFLLAEHDKADLDRALELARQALVLRPDAPDIMDTVGWVYFKRGEMDKARTYIKKALEKSPESSILNYHMAMVYQVDGRSELVREGLEKALLDNQRFSGRGNAEKILSELR